MMITQSNNVLITVPGSILLTVSFDFDSATNNNFITLMKYIKESSRTTKKKIELRYIRGVKKEAKLYFLDIANILIGMKKSMKKRLELGVITQKAYDDFLRMPGPEGAAAIVLYLSTDQAANINGEAFFCQTGKIARYSRPVEVKGIYKEGLWTLEELMGLFPDTLG